MAAVTVTRSDRGITGTVSLPASKSISNRLLMIRALSGVSFRIGNLSAAEDTMLMQALLDRISPAHDLRHPESMIRDMGYTILDAGNAGTVLRFLTALLAVTPGRWLLQGSDRMHLRPVGILVEALRSLGASVEYAGMQGYPPLRITGRPLKGGEVSVDGSVSSQYASALLLVAPALSEGLTLRLTGEQVSLPYMEMTARLMKEFGIGIGFSGSSVIVKPGPYMPPASESRGTGAIPSGPDVYRVEPDWSAAAFWYEAAALAGHGELRLVGLKRESLQGDAIVAELFTQLGVETVSEGDGILLKSDGGTGAQFNRYTGGVNQQEHLRSAIESIGNHPDPRPLTFDLKNHPDLAPALIVTCSALGIPARFTGMHHLRIKESDRLEALVTEIRHLGRPIRHPAPGTLELFQALPLEPVSPDSSTRAIQSYGDHRIAMAFAPLALVTGSIRIEGPEVVSKSYPGFWEELKTVGMNVRMHE